MDVRNVLSPDGQIHYFARQGVDDLTSQDHLTSQSYSYRAERLNSFFFNSCNLNDGTTWSTPFVIDDPSVYVVNSTRVMQLVQGQRHMSYGENKSGQRTVRIRVDLAKRSWAVMQMVMKPPVRSLRAFVTADTLLKLIATWAQRSGLCANLSRTQVQECLRQVEY